MKANGVTVATPFSHAKIQGEQASRTRRSRQR